MNFTAKQQAMMVSALSLAVQEGKEDMTAIADTLGEPWAFAIESSLNLQDHLDPEPVQDEPEDFPLCRHKVLIRFQEIEKSYKEEIDAINVALFHALTDLAAAEARLDSMSAE